MPFDDALPTRALTAVGAEPILTPAAIEARNAGSAPSTGDIVEAEFRQNNQIASLLTSKTFLANNDPDPAYDPWQDVKGTKYEQHWRSFVEANNPAYAAQMKRQIDQETEDKRTMAAGGFTGFLSGMAAGLLDPTNLLPIAGAVRAARGGYSVSRTALMTGASVGAGVAAQEVGLQALQQTRSLEESFTNIGSGVLLGAMLGTGAAGLLNRGEVVRAERALSRMYPDENGVVHGGDLSAAQRERLGIEDLTIDGRIARNTAEATAFINPVLRSNVRASPAAREIAQQLGENTLYQQAHNRGIAISPGGSAETLRDVAYRSRMAEAVGEHDEIFSEMRKGGIKLSRADFEEQVGNAMRNGDTALDGNPHVTRAAEAWRARVFEPFKKEAIDLGLLPADVSTDTAASYFSRVYNREAMTAREGEFRERVTPYIRQQVEEQFAAHQESTRGRIAQLQAEMEDLRRPAEERAALLGELKTAGDALDGGNAASIERLSNINDARLRARAAREAGDRAGARTAREEAARLREEGGPELQNYLRERAALRRRSNILSKNEAALTERGERLAQSLTDLESAQEKSLERLITRGQVFERNMQRLDPEKWDAERERLVEAYRDAGDKAIRATERSEKAIAKLRETAQKKIEAAKKVEDGTAPDKAATEEARRDIATADRLEKDAKASRARAEAMSTLASRIERIDNFDPVATLEEFRKSLGQTVEQLKNLSLSRGERAQRIIDQARGLTPEQIAKKIDAEMGKRTGAISELERGFYDRWEVRHLGDNVDLAKNGARFDTAAQQIVDDVFNKIVGRDHGSEAALPEYMTPITRGPLKERTFNVPDALIQDFLVSNVREVGDRYARTMAAETALARRFGRADMRDQIQAINDDYRRLRETVIGANTADEALAAIGKNPGMVDDFKAWAKDQNLAQSSKENVLAWLQKDQAGALHDIQSMRDLVRGTYKVGAGANGGFSRVSRGLLSFNYIRLMGSVAIANLTEIFRPAMVHGLGAYMSEGVAPLIKNMGAVKMSVEEARLAGLVTERLLHNRLATMGEVGDPYARGTAAERILTNGANIASRWNGISLITDMNEAMASTLSQNRVLRGALGKDDRRFLAYLDVNDELADRIAAQFKEHGEVLDGVHVARTEQWTDANAVRAYRSAINKDVSSIIVKRGVGDIPLWGNTPVGQLALQFRGFTLAAHSRVMLRGMQEGTANFVTGLIAMTALGAMASYFSAVRGGADRLEKWKQSAANPGFLIGEGLDKAGLFPVMFEAADTVDKFARMGGTPFNPIKTPLASAFPGSAQPSEGGRYAQRDVLAAIAGPTAGLPTQIGRAMGSGFGLVSGQDAGKAANNAAIGLLPYGTYLGVREMLQLVTGDSPYAK